MALVREIFAKFQRDRALSQGAALAYYTIFSLAPVLVLIIAIAGLVLGRGTAQGEIVARVRGVVGDDAAAMLESMITQITQPSTGIVASGVSLLTMLFGASGVFGQLQVALNDIFRAEPQPGGVRALLRQRLSAFAMILGIGMLLLLALGLSTVLTAAHSWLVERFPVFGPSLPALNFGVSFVVMTLLFALIYKVLPDVELRWGEVLLGAAFTALLFSVGRSLLGLYLGRAGATSVYGAAGSLVLILLWIYYSAQMLLLGAVFTEVFARHYGSLKPPVDEGEPMQQPLGSI